MGLFKGAVATQFLVAGQPTVTSGLSFGQYTMTGTRANVVVQNKSKQIVTNGFGGTGAAFFYSFPTSGTNANRFLLLATTTDSNVHNVVLYDLASLAPGPGKSLGPFNGSVALQTSPDGQAFLLYYGVKPTVFRSDTGEWLCSSEGTALEAWASIDSPTSVGTRTIIIGTNSGEDSCPYTKAATLAVAASTDFGTTAPDTPASRTISFRNTGSDCLVVSAISTSLHFRPTVATAFSLKPGSAAGVPFVFAPGGEVGSFTESLSIARNAEAKGPTTVTLSGMSVPVCSSFGYSPWGQCQPSGVQTRTLLSASPPDCIGGNPVLTQDCTYVPTCTSFMYSDWGQCQMNGIQTRTVLSSVPTGCTGGAPVLEGTCAYVLEPSLIFVSVLMQGLL